jgi:hypothetical protein
MSMLSRLFVKKERKRVAVVVPLSTRSELMPEEQISLRHLVHFLGDYDKFLVVPKGQQTKLPGFGIKPFFCFRKSFTRLSWIMSLF